MDEKTEALNTTSLVSSRTSFSSKSDQQNSSFSFHTTAKFRQLSEWHMVGGWQEVWQKVKENIRIHDLGNSRLNNLSRGYVVEEVNKKGRGLNI